MHILHDSRETELEVELPCRELGRRIAILVHESETELNDLQKINIAAQQLILVVGLRSELADGTGNDT